MYAAAAVTVWRSPPTPFDVSPKNTRSAAIAPSTQTIRPISSLRKRLKRSSFSNAWWWPSEPPRIRIESAARLAALHVDVPCDGVPGLVDRDRARLVGDVLDADRGARLERRSSPRRGAASSNAGVPS